jgi:hypothetical protein
MASRQHDAGQGSRPGQGTREPSGAARSEQETDPAQEWGGRESQGKAIARGGKEKGHVEGATEQPPA